VDARDKREHDDPAATSTQAAKATADRQQPIIAY
jgi:hypothetical protein